MASEWRTCQIGDLGAVVTGRTPPGSRTEYFGGDIPFLTPTDMDGRRSVGTTSRSLSEQGRALLKNAIVPHGVAVSCIGWQMGKAILIDRPVITNQQINSIIPDPAVVDASFLYYALAARRSEIFALGAGGSRTPILNKSGFQAFRVDLPPLLEQRGIADVLGALDDKIELNQKMNETLEAMARALFKSWFVDFDPVRAKAEGRPTGLPAPIAALFPDSFEDSEFGETPKGWSVAGLDEIATFLNGLALQKYPATGETFLPAIKIAQLRAGNTEGADFVSGDVPNSYRIQDGDVLFSWSGSLECQVWTGGTGALNQHLFKVTSEAYPKWFYVQWIMEHLANFRRIAAAKATTMGHIQRHHLSQALVLIPPSQLTTAMGAHMEPLLEAQIGRMLESRSLISLRNMLLPKLITGEIHLRDMSEGVSA